jgi:hypothetical protein
MSENNEESKAGTEPTKFEAAAGSGKPPGILREFLDFLAHNKKWWLLPIVIVLLLLGVLLVLAPGAAPFIYTLF